MIPTYRPYLNLVELIAALSIGRGRDQFETAVAARIGARYALAFAYGHSGLIGSLRALGLTNTEIILPAYTCTVMADAIIASGNCPVFVDIDLTDYNMDLSAMQTALTPQTRAIIATHMYGYPANVNAIREAAGNNRLIIEDRALGLLTSTPGMTGVQGDLALFSFGPTKHLFTVQGGIIATNSAELYEKIKAYRDRTMAQMSPTLWVKRWLRLFASYLSFGQAVSWRGLRNKIRPATESISDPEGTNASLVGDDYATAYTNFQARIGLSQFSKLEEVLTKRQHLVEFYDCALRDVPGLIPAPILPGATYSHYTIRVSGRDKIDFRQQMRARQIEVGQIYDRVLPFRDRFRQYAKDSYPQTQRATAEVVNLPLYPGLSLAQAQYIVESVRHVLQ